MGLFKSIKKAFKKVTRGIKKVVKGVVKGVKKVVKKISSSKILKALAIAAAVVVTGGAAIAAFTGGTAASGTFAGWMMNASQAVTGGSLFGTSTALARGAGTVAKFVASPFKAVGTALGSAAATVTDFTGLTTEAGRTGFVPSGLTDAEISQVLTETPASIASSTTSGTLNLPTTLPAAGPVPTQLSTGTLTMPTTLPAGTSIGTSSGVVGTQITGGATAQLSQTVPAALNIDPSVATQATQSWAQRNPNTAKFLTNVGTGVATSVATGYAMQQIAGDPEETGSMAGLRTEGASSFDPLRVYAAERGIADADISKYFTFGNTAEAGNMPLFQQQTIGVA
jgi:hypothetical protein